MSVEITLYGSGVGLDKFKNQLANWPNRLQNPQPN